MYKKILIYNSGGGLGDSIQLFSLILSIKNHFKKCELYYLTSHDNHFEGKLNEYGINLKPLKLKIKYFGFRWWHILYVRQKVKELNIDEFDLIIDLQSKIRNTLILKIIPHKHFISSTFNFKFSKPAVKIKKTNNINNNILNSINVAFKTNCKLIPLNQNLIDKIWSKTYIFRL